MPCPDEKLVERSPVIDSSAVTAAAACSPSGSMKISGRPEMLMCPLADSSAQYSPIWVDGVIGYAPAASLDSRSHMITAVLPSIACRTPGNRKVCLALMVWLALTFAVRCLHPRWQVAGPPTRPGAASFG